MKLSDILTQYIEEFWITQNFEGHNRSSEFEKEESNNKVVAKDIQSSYLKLISDTNRYYLTTKDDACIGYI